MITKTTEKQGVDTIEILPITVSNKTNNKQCLHKCEDSCCLITDILFIIMKGIFVLTLMLLGIVCFCDKCHRILIPFEKRWTTRKKDSVGNNIRFDICECCWRKKNYKDIPEYYNKLMSSILGREIEFVLTRKIYIIPFPILTFLYVLWYNINLYNLSKETGAAICSTFDYMLTISTIHQKRKNNILLTENEIKIYNFMEKYYLPENLTTKPPDKIHYFNT